MRSKTCLAVLATCTALALMLSPAGPAAADDPGGDEPLPGYTDGTPPLPPLMVDGEPTRVVQGMYRHAAYYVEVPPKWNGQLVVWAHGFQGGQKILRAGPPDAGLREEFLEQGYAWAASSFPTTGYDVGPAVTSSHDLAEYAATELLGHRPTRTYLAGGSMGGHVLGRSLEEYPKYYAGALSLCGQLGDIGLVDYYADTNLAAQALAGVDAYPMPEDYQSDALPLIKKRLGLTDLQVGKDPTTVAGRQYQQMLTDLSGGPRPGADVALGLYSDALFSLAPTGPGVQQTLFTRYEPTSPVDINRTVERMAPVNWAERNSRELNAVPRIMGEPRVPVLSLHNIGDLFVPLSMEQIYARKVAVHGQSGLLVQRGIRSGMHCDFTNGEAGKAWKDLTTWVERRAARGDAAARPAGDDFLNRKKVGAPTFGCRFTDPTASTSAWRTFFPACPKKGVQHSR
ncbi:hypothetical protein ACF1HJ_33835 [Streptomyces sp. NPDC013978]|uniref:hypothetical protein n=1 Tax=Streptomyces sp. NPDC013978 TaxID=3364869 RepID=UPI0036F668BD